MAHPDIEVLEFRLIPGMKDSAEAKATVRWVLSTVEYINTHSRLRWYSSNKSEMVTPQTPATSSEFIEQMKRLGRVTVSETPPRILGVRGTGTPRRRRTTNSSHQTERERSIASMITRRRAEGASDEGIRVSLRMLGVTEEELRSAGL